MIRAASVMVRPVNGRNVARATRLTQERATTMEQDWLDDAARFADSGAHVTVTATDGEHTDFDLNAEELQTVFHALASASEPRRSTPRFYVQDAEEGMLGMFGIVDATAGGVIEWFVIEANAKRRADQLNKSATNPAAWPI